MWIKSKIVDIHGQWNLVAALCRASLAAGAHGLLIEVVQDGVNRGQLLSDGEQGIPRDVLEEIMDEVKQTRVPAPGAVPAA